MSEHRKSRKLIPVGSVMSIAVQQNQQSEVQGYSSSEVACKDQIVRWLDEIDEFSSDQLHQTAHGLSEVSLKNLQIHAREYTANRVAESKEVCLQQQREVKFDKRLLLQSLTKGTGALGGGTGCSLAAMSSAGILAMAAIGTGGALCVFFLGSDCLRTYQRAHPEARKRALIHTGKAYKNKINHLFNRIQFGLDHRIEVARIQRDLDLATTENAKLRRSFDAVNETVVQLRNELNEAKLSAGALEKAGREMIDEVRDERDRANQVAERLRADLERANQISDGLRTDLDIANLASARFRSELDAANAATQALRSDLDAVKIESKTTQRRLESKIDALICAMDGNSTGKSVSDLMRSRAVSTPQAPTAADESESLVVDQQENPQDEEFIYVSSTTEDPFADKRACANDAQLLSPQDAASNYHLARADQQIASSRKVH